MYTLIDSDLISLMSCDSYIRDIVDCEIDKINKLEKNYEPISIHLKKFDISIVSFFGNKDHSEVHIRLVI